MAESDPSPSEHGQRVPPPRLPPTAVGTATPEPAGWVPRRPSSWFARWRAWIATAAVLILAGLGGVLRSQTAELKAVSWTVLAFGIGTLGLRVWLAVAPSIELRRRTRWIRARQAAVGPRRDHPPNER